MSSYNELIYGLGDFFTWTFKILPALGNLPNYLYAFIMFAGVLYWLRWQKQLSQEAREKGGIE